MLGWAAVTASSSCRRPSWRATSTRCSSPSSAAAASTWAGTSAGRPPPTPPARSWAPSPAASASCRSSPRPAAGASSWRFSSPSASRRPALDAAPRPRRPPRPRRDRPRGRRARSSRPGPPPPSVTAGSGRGAWRPRDLASPNATEDWLREQRRSVVWEAEGRESSVALLGSTGLAFAVNGKVDGHSRYDAGTQVMAGLLGALLHPAPRRVLVVGLGTGSTAGWLADVPGRRAGGRGRARARGGGGGPAVRARQPQRPREPEAAPLLRRRARAPPHHARALRPRRLRAVEPLPRRDREPLQPGLLPRGGLPPRGGRALPAVGPGLRGPPPARSGASTPPSRRSCRRSRPGRPCPGTSCW